MAEPRILDLSEEEIEQAIRTDGASLDTQDEQEEEVQEEVEEEESEESEDIEESEESEEEDESGEDSDESEQSEETEESEEVEESSTEDEDDFSLDSDIDFNEISGGLVQDEQSLRDFFKTLSDPYIMDAINYYKETGTLAPYAMAQTYGSEDYWKGVSDVDVVRQKLQLEYAEYGLPQEEVNALIEEELERFVLDPDDHTESEIKRAQAKLKLAASKARKEFVDEYKKFASPPKKEKQEAPQKSPEEIARDKAATINRLKSSLKKNVKDNKIAFKAGETSVELQISPKTLVEMGSDQRKIIKSLFDKEGKDLDWETIAFLSNKEAYKAAIQNAASKDGTREFVDRELKNKPKKKPTKKSKTIAFDQRGIPRPEHWGGITEL